MAEEVALAQKSDRLISLDVFRGLTIASMILVNNPGTWGKIYAPLGHAPWHGWTPTDFIFPFFLFMVGTAMTFSFDKRIARGESRRRLAAHVVARAAVLFLLGLILTGFPNFRLITPYILGILGIELLLENPKSATEGRGSMWRGIGWVALALGVVWFAVDFRYFNGPTNRSGFNLIDSSTYKYLFPTQVDPEDSYIRVPGVLQRIALCYAAAAAIMLLTKGWVGRLAWALILINAYWVIMKFVDAPAGYIIGNGVPHAKMDAPDGAVFPGGLNDWIDVKLLGRHLYSARPDPEGLLSTIPAVATTLFGILTGAWIRNKKFDNSTKAVGLFAAGNALFIIGACMDCFMPINKKIWTSSYVIFMAGWAGIILGACYYLIDVRGFKKWATPFLVLGTNAILAFFASGLLARMMSMVRWEVPRPPGYEPATITMNIKSWSYQFFTDAFANPKNASLAWALCYVGLWVLLVTPLYRKRIFLKV